MSPLRMARFVTVAFCIFITACTKPVYISADPLQQLPKDTSAAIFSSRRMMTITAIDTWPVQRPQGLQEIHFLVSPGQHSVSVEFNETVSATTTSIPLSKGREITYTVIPEQTFSGQKKLWIHAEAGKEYRLATTGSPPHWILWLEDAKTGQVVSGTKPLNAWTAHQVSRYCDEKSCRPSVVESDFKSGHQNCRRKDFETDEVLRSCQGQECEGTDICYDTSF